MAYGIITHYDVHNHGALLQLNALVKVLNDKFGIEAQALRFDKNYDFMGREKKAKYEISPRSIGIYLHYLSENGLRKMLYNVRKRRTLERFKAENRLVGEYYTECGQLDGIIVGSDEVFALHTGPTPAFFGHALPADKVFAYAGSFGPTTIDDIERLHCRALVAGGLKSMTGLAMRDRNSRDIVQELTGREAEAVCDPVILYGYEREIAAFKPLDVPPYLLIYAYDRNMNGPEEVAVIKQYAHRHGLKIVSPGFFHKWADRNVNTDPVELLRWFAGAKCVVTDTFHGTVMSIITGRDVAVKLRDNGNKLGNLLEEYRLTDRIVGKWEELPDVLAQATRHDDVRGEVERRRRDSMDYLEKMIRI